uniref:Uncharacterized protein n=1 Tax=Anguilla anguilla TaxID=7936 RepID=A0A0E9XY42_ANGAN
MLNIYFTLLQ